MTRFTKRQKYLSFNDVEGHLRKLEEFRSYLSNWNSKLVPGCGDYEAMTMLAHAIDTHQIRWTSDPEYFWACGANFPEKTFHVSNDNTPEKS